MENKRLSRQARTSEIGNSLFFFVFEVKGTRDLVALEVDEVETIRLSFSPIGPSTRTLEGLTTTFLQLSDERRECDTDPEGEGREATSGKISGRGSRDSADGDKSWDGAGFGGDCETATISVARTKERRGGNVSTGTSFSSSCAAGMVSGL
jgi:hypothetical protein